MIRWLNIILFILAISSLVGVYYIKYQTIEKAEQKIALEQKIKEQKNELSLLRADWAFLNQPAYIEPIIIRHQEKLALRPVEQKQFIRFSDLADRGISEAERQALSDLFESLDKGVDPIGSLIEELAQ